MVFLSFRYRKCVKFGSEVLQQGLRWWVSNAKSIDLWFNDWLGPNCLVSSFSISAGPSIPNEFITDHTIDGEQNISKLLNVVDNDAAHWIATLPSVYVLYTDS